MEEYKTGYQKGQTKFLGISFLTKHGNWETNLINNEERELQLGKEYQKVLNEVIENLDKTKQ